MSEVARVPNVFLTPRAFRAAQAAHIVGIEPNPEGMHLMSEVPGIPEEFLPDITIFRLFARTYDRWDIDLPTAVPAETYHPASELVRKDRNPESWRLEQIRKKSVGQKILQVTVHSDWNNLGPNLAKSLTETGRLGRPKNLAGGLAYTADATATASTILMKAFGLNIPLTSYDRAIANAANIQPYTIKYRE